MKDKNPFFITENINSGRRAALSWVEDSAPLEAIYKPTGEFLDLALSVKKLKFFLLIVLIGLLILLFKSFSLQILRGDYYFTLAEGNRIRFQPIKAQRGVIYDREGVLLVQNVPGFSLLVVPSYLPRSEEERQEILDQVSIWTSIPLEEIKDKINQASRYYFQPVVIQSNIDYEKAMALKIASADLSSVFLENDYWRQYLIDPSLSHILGYVGKLSPEEYESRSREYLLSDNIGKTGLERYYESYLRGQHGRKQVEVDSLGREKKIIAQTPATGGSDLILTIDQRLQSEIYQILIRYLGASRAAVVIVSNPKNGEILALVDYPSYDNNLFSRGISHEDYQSLLNNPLKPLFVRSIAGEYPSGSTIKPVVAAAALEEGVINRQTTFNSVGGLWVSNLWFFPDWRSGGHGLTNVLKALADSVNTYFYYIGGGYGDFSGLGPERIAKYLRLFGLGEILGIDLLGEKSGLVPTPEWKKEVKKEAWYIGNTYHLSIGQGDLLVTPLQVNSYTVAIANGGTLYQPHLVKEIVNRDGAKELIMPTIIRQDFINSANLEIVRQGMRQAVTGGSARALYYLPVAVAGKTGTAQWNPNRKNHAWFTAFAPYHQPSFAITVLVEEGGEGSEIAVPIAGEIIRFWFDQE